ncbi:hypothetical protein QFZ82_003316 [Streptomyces sp. V4I23]|uniref:hypothetical protein n=1 Tax=Streptomyces sp. V4I23 TaxID=3042282 RepID=UPI002780763F|nr:hypothetical protein [Streptomyces sp. V4I23]MDQ1008831.1 hypothetical protein [Streptomyces sp. V4I23]
MLKTSDRAVRHLPEGAMKRGVEATGADFIYMWGNRGNTLATPTGWWQASQHL